MRWWLAGWALGLVSCEAADAPTRPEAGPSVDRGLDAQPPPDATVDRGLRDDSTPAPDGQALDAATEPDARQLPDAAPAPDADPRADGSPPRDAGPPQDAASPPDAQVVPDACAPPPDHAAPPLAERNRCGSLSYGRYPNRGDGEPAVNRLPDFSHAGYRGGGVPLPAVPTVAELAEPSGGDDRARIQAALDDLAARAPGPDGLRGALLLRRGEWRVGDTLYLRASGVVLRGEGQGADGTRIVATRRAQHDLLVVQGEAGLREVPDTRQPVEDERAPVGTRRLTLADARGFAAGDVVAVLRTPNQRWIDTLDMARWGWRANSYAIAHERRVVAVEGDVVVLDIPLVDGLEARFGGGAVYRADVSGRIQQVGVEGLRLEAVFDGPEDEDHAWKAIRFEHAQDSWVRQVTTRHFGFGAVSFERGSSFNTVEEVAALDPVSRVTGSRRYSFNVSGGVGNLFQRCYSEEARHDFVTGSRVTGPHVWLDCYSTRSSNDDGPHHRWATGLLFDNVHSRWLHVENRGPSGTGHGWSGAQVMFWNSLAEGVRCDAPEGAMNWTVGTAGAEQDGQWVPEEPPGWWASAGAPVEPRSLYLQQLADRLGPAAAQAVTTRAQREGRVWGQLAAWAGEGRLADAGAAPGDPRCADGIAHGGVCCAAACGECGGPGCGARPGGSTECCQGRVLESGRSCAAVGAPCVLDPDFVPIAP